MMLNKSTITAICTPQGQGALGIIRISGAEAIAITQKIFSKNITAAKGYTAHYGNILKGNEILDEVIINIFRAPHSFTKEDVVEISCHGSPYILEQVLQLIVENGARLAEAGEFTKRAFLHGAMDLAQAEAVADLIVAESAAAHKVALKQLKGGFSTELKVLREKLLNFVSLIELELDFAEEDVEFADRTALKKLISEILAHIKKLISSFRLGNVIKKGVPVAIVGKPNAGKSTLLNALLGEEKAIVSHIAGTTRDVIEDVIQIGGILFRFMDTAGLRETEDFVEKIGVERALEKMKEAQIILLIYDAATENLAEMRKMSATYQEKHPETQLILVANKVDLVDNFLDISVVSAPLNDRNDPKIITEVAISAKENEGIEALKDILLTCIGKEELASNDTILTNVRHVEALRQAQTALLTVLEGLDMGLTSDLVSIDIRTALHYIGSITGEINTEEILGNIFGKFCIGK